MKNQKGITLIALVITIIVLLILAGVAIAMLSGDNGILTKASHSSEATAMTSAKEKVTLAVNEAITNYYDDTYVAGNKTSLVAAVNAALTTLNNNEETGAKIEYTAAKEATTEPAAAAVDGTVTITFKGDESVKITGTVKATSDDSAKAGTLVWADGNKY